MTRLTNGKIVSSGEIIERANILVENGIITDVAPSSPSENSIDLNGNYIAPGFIELHCHGAIDA